MKKYREEIKWLYDHAKSIFWFLIGDFIIISLLSLLGIYSAFISKSLIDAATAKDIGQVYKWVIIMVLFFLLTLVLSALSSILTTRCNTTLLNNIQKQTYEKVLSSEWLSLNRYHSVNLLTRMVEDINTIVVLITSTLGSIISLIITFIGSFIALLCLNATIALVAITIAPLFLVLSMFLGKAVKKIYLKVQNHTIHYNTFIQESLKHILIIKTFCKENEKLKQLECLQKRTLQLNLQSNNFGLIVSSLLSLGHYITYIIVFLIGGTRLAQGLMTFGTLTALLQLFRNIQNPLSHLANLLPTVVRSFTSIERVMEIQNLPQDALDSSLPTDSLPPTITFNHICYSYQPNQPVLKDLSLTVYPGTIIGFIGPSGCGKTTLIRLLLSLIHPESGYITLTNDNESRPLSTNDRHLISYVPQGNTLFSGTIRENLFFTNTKASLLDIKEELQAACAFDFINQLEQGLDTYIGENGVGISEGQAQRLSICRALLRKKPILILDEVTSSLDPTSELHILKSIKNLNYKPTCLIITHRPSALSICDSVYSIEEGILKRE